MRIVFLGMVVFSLPAPALAYVGPGAGLGVIAVAFAVVLGLALLFFGFLWFPLKRMLNRNKLQKNVTTTEVVPEVKSSPQS